MKYNARAVAERLKRPASSVIAAACKQAAKSLGSPSTSISEEQLASDINVRHFGAKGNGSDDSAAIQAAINFAMGRHAPNNTLSGAEVVFPPGVYGLKEPLILPPSSQSAYIAVQLRGTNEINTVLQGLDGFPAGRGLIEWACLFPSDIGQISTNLVAPTTGIWGALDQPIPALHQRIRSLRLALPPSQDAAALLRPYPKLTVYSFWTGSKAGLIPELCADLVDKNAADPAALRVLIYKALASTLATGTATEQSLLNTIELHLDPAAGARARVRVRALLLLWPHLNQVYEDDSAFWAALHDDGDDVEGILTAAFADAADARRASPGWTREFRRWRDRAEPTPVGRPNPRLVSEELIANLTSSTPSTEAVESFRSAFAQTRVTKSTVLGESRFRLHGRFEDLLITGSNAAHRRLMRLMGSVFRSTFRNVVADCSPTARIGGGLYGPRFDTIVLHVDDGIDGWFGADVGGLQLSLVDGLHAGQTQSGFHQVFRGRINHTSWRSTFADGTFAAPSFDLRNSVDSTFSNVATEGRADKPIVRLTNCHGVVFEQIGVGSPVKQGSAFGEKAPKLFSPITEGLTPAELADMQGQLAWQADQIGHGIELHGSTGCRLEGRTTNGLSGARNRALDGVALVAFDRHCYRNRVERFEATVYSEAEVTALVELPGEVRGWNHVSGYVHRFANAAVGHPDQPGGTLFTMGTAPEYWG